MFESKWATFRNKMYPIQQKAIDVAATAEIVAAPGAGQKVVLISFWLSASGAVNAKWQSGSTDKTGLMYFAAAGASFVVPRGGVVECAANEALNLNLSGSVPLDGHCEYIVVPSDA